MRGVETKYGTTKVLFYGVLDLFALFIVWYIAISRPIKVQNVAIGIDG